MDEVDQLDLFGESSPPARLKPFDSPTELDLEPDRTHPNGLLVGACAWNNPSFEKYFYPTGLPKSKQLAYYAKYFNAIEVDSTFYRVPRVETTRGWNDQTPDDFRFAVKVPQSITHDAQLSLENRQARTDWDLFRRAMEGFGTKLCAVLLQLGPRVSFVRFTELRKIIEEATGLPLVVEFRHPSWNITEVETILRETGTVRAWADQYLNPRMGVREETAHLYDATGDFRFIRLMGNLATKYNPNAPSGRNYEYGTILFDREADCKKWIKKASQELVQQHPVMIFISNHYEGNALLTAERLRKGLL